MKMITKMTPYMVELMAAQLRGNVRPGRPGPNAVYASPQIVRAAEQLNRKRSKATRSRTNG